MQAGYYYKEQCQPYIGKLLHADEVYLLEEDEQGNPVLHWKKAEEDEQALTFGHYTWKMIYDLFRLGTWKVIKDENQKQLALLKAFWYPFQLGDKLERIVSRNCLYRMDDNEDGGVTVYWSMKDGHTPNAGDYTHSTTYSYFEALNNIKTGAWVIKKHI